jgi:membrane-associated phospholipid phosphatase
VVRPTLPHRLGLALAGLLLSSVVYGVTGAFMNDTLPTRILPTVLDGVLPFAPAAVVVYLGLYAVALGPLALADDLRFLARGAMAYSLILFLALPIWIIWPVTYPREAVEVTDLFTWGVAVTHWIDPPTNCFPSMHVAETVLAAMLVGRLDRRLSPWFWGASAMVWWSTLALRQHWVLDGVAGAALAWLAVKLSFDLRPLPAEALVAGPPRRMLWLGLFFVVLFVIGALPYWTGLVDPDALRGRWTVSSAP